MDRILVILSHKMKYLSWGNATLQYENNSYIDSFNWNLVCAYYVLHTRPCPGIEFSLNIQTQEILNGSQVFVFL